ncbi:MAG: iron-containing alcohol dehydrogenase [Deltaproteobacteria bacterium]|nr:iron-containing alcohol dehydrogenase [Deltaproteobacteria bacterium]
MQGYWNYPTSIRFGAGRVKELSDACAELGIKKPLLVTDPGLKALPFVGAMMSQLKENGLDAEVFAKVEANPTGKNVDDGMAACRAHGADGVIAAGGGSALDAAKAIALAVHQGRPLWDFEDIGDNYKRVEASKMLPVVALPTTAGTGSEVGRASVIVHEAEARKAIIFHAGMLPARVIADPELTLTLPKHLTAATGMDALSHNLEALCAGGFHPQADGIAVEGIRLVQEHLEQAVEHGDDVNARAGMLASSLMGATAFQKGLGAMHAMAHPFGAQLHTHHGAINAVVMPYVLERNRAAIAPAMTRLQRVLQLPGDDACDAMISWVLEMRKKLDIPHTLEKLGMNEDHISALAKGAVSDAAAGGNPIALTEEDYATLFKKALQGDL